MFVTSADVYGATKLDSTVVPEADVNNFILASEVSLLRQSKTVYMQEEVNSTATSATSTTLTDTSQTFTSNQYANHFLWIFSGTGANQMRKIISNNTNTLTVGEAFSTIPDATSQYQILYTPPSAGVSPISEGKKDGNDKQIMYFVRYPFLGFERLSIHDSSISLNPTDEQIFIYNDFGKIQLGTNYVVNSSSSLSGRYVTFPSYPPQAVSFRFAYGVIGVPELEKRYVVVVAALKTLAAQIGGTYNVPSTYSVPEGNITIGQAYINIRETYNSLQGELNELIIPNMRIYQAVLVVSS